MFHDLLKLISVILLPGIFLLTVGECPESDGAPSSSPRLPEAESSPSKPPERIVSLNPDLTENVIALGAGGRLVGVSDFCPLPADSDGVDRLGSLQNPGLERITTLAPDLVLATREGNSPETVRRLRDLGIKVTVFDEARNFTDYFSFLRRLGRILGREEAAARRIGELAAVVEQVRTDTSSRPPVSVFVQIGLQPLITASRQTLIGEMIELVGGENIAASLSPRYPVISREQVLLSDPAVIIIAAMGSEARWAVTSWERFPEMRAVKNRRVFSLDPDTVCRLGPRLEEGLKRIARFISSSGQEEVR